MKFLFGIYLLVSLSTVFIGKGMGTPLLKHHMLEGTYHKDDAVSIRHRMFFDDKQNEPTDHSNQSDHKKKIVLGDQSEFNATSTAKVSSLATVNPHHTRQHVVDEKMVSGLPDWSTVGAILELSDDASSKASGEIPDVVKNDGMQSRFVSGSRFGLSLSNFISTPDIQSDAMSESGLKSTGSARNTLMTPTVYSDIMTTDEVRLEFERERELSVSNFMLASDMPDGVSGPFFNSKTMNLLIKHKMRYALPSKGSGSGPHGPIVSVIPENVPVQSEEGRNSETGPGFSINNSATARDGQIVLSLVNDKMDFQLGSEMELELLVTENFLTSPVKQAHGSGSGLDLYFSTSDVILTSDTISVNSSDDLVSEITAEMTDGKFVTTSDTFWTLESEKASLESTVKSTPDSYSDLMTTEGLRGGPGLEWEWGLSVRNFSLQSDVLDDVSGSGRKLTDNFVTTSDMFPSFLSEVSGSGAITNSITNAMVYSDPPMTNGLLSEFESQSVSNFSIASNTRDYVSESELTLTDKTTSKMAHEGSGLRITLRESAFSTTSHISLATSNEKAISKATVKRSITPAYSDLIITNGLSAIYFSSASDMAASDDGGLSQSEMAPTLPDFVMEHNAFSAPDVSVIPVSYPAQVNDDMKSENGPGLAINNNIEAINRSSVNSGTRSVSGSQLESLVTENILIFGIISFNSTDVLEVESPDSDINMDISEIHLSSCTEGSEVMSKFVFCAVLLFVSCVSQYVILVYNQ